MNRNRSQGEHKTASIMLSSLDPEQIKEVLSRCTRLSYTKNAQVVREKDPDGHIYIIEKGTLGVAQFSNAGKEVSFHYLTKGENFGEVSAIDGKSRSASVIALTDCVVTKMSFEVFRDLIYAHTSVCVEIMRQLAAMVRRLSGRVFEFATLSVPGRVHAELFRIARMHLDLDGVARIPSPPTHARIAAKVSCNREAVSRELKKLENDGLLIKVVKGWEISDFAELQGLVHASQSI